MDIPTESIKSVAEKALIYNTDINQHIISCRRALQIIELKDKQLKIAYETLNNRYNEKIRLQRRISELEEELKILMEKNELIRIEQNDNIKIQRQIILESYKQIHDLIYGRE